MVDEERGWATPVPRGSDRWRVLAVPVLLALVASFAVWRSATQDQSSWQGASFGMFATYDNTISRSVAVTVTDAEGSRRIALPADLRDDARRLRVLPTEGGADRLARSVLEQVDDAQRVDVVVRRFVIEQPPGDEGLRLSVEDITEGSATR